MQRLTIPTSVTFFSLKAGFEKREHVISELCCLSPIQPKSM